MFARFLFVILASTFFLTSCDEAGWNSNNNDNNDDNNNSSSERDFFGPNAIWQLSFDDNDSFTLTRKNNLDDIVTQVNIQGTYQTLSSGYTRFTVNNPGGAISSSFVGLIIGDESVLLEPVETSSSQILAFIEQGNCPEAIVDGLWLKYKFETGFDTSDGDSEFFGTWRYNPDTSSLVIRDDYSLADMSSTLGGETFNSENCSEGLSADTEYAHFLSETYSTFSIDKDDGSISQFRLGLPESQVNSSTEFNGNYVGLLYESLNNSSTLVSAECTDGVCSIFNVDDVENIQNVTSSHELTLDGTPDTPEDGFITGTWQNTENETANIACAVIFDVDADEHTFLACVGQYPAATISDVANLFLLSND